MLLFLSETAIAARENADEPIEAVAARARRSANAIRNFEAGQSWPQDIDRVMAAYADLADLPDALALWQAALDLWAEHGSAPMLGRRDDAQFRQRAVDIVREQVRRSRQGESRRATAGGSNATPSRTGERRAAR